MEEDDVTAARIYCEQLVANINDYKIKALTEKRAGNNPKAIQHMQKMKEEQKLLDE